MQSIMPNDPVVPILLDTDIGSDIDDALCLSYLLRQPRCALLGITTVSGEPRQRAMLADAVCRAAGRTDVPIHSGTDAPLLVTQRQPEAPQQEALADFPHRTDIAPNTAVEFLRETIRRQPGEITLLTIGPLTNIGLLFALDPEIPRLLKGLVMMGGVFTTRIPDAPRCEWNIHCDPHAAAIVYRAAKTANLSIGLDVTLRCRMDAAECRRALRGGPLDVAARMAEVWFRYAGEITFHDPLAGAVIFAPELCAYADGRVEVELAGERILGMTHWETGSEQPHRIAIDVHPDRFFAHYFSVAQGTPAAQCPVG